jgi:hypothetical protein
MSKYPKSKLNEGIFIRSIKVSYLKSNILKPQLNSKCCSSSMFALPLIKNMKAGANVLKPYLIRNLQIFVIS